MENTTNLKMPLLVSNQSQKEITHNEALIIIDNILQNGVIDKDLTTPPSNPNSNDIYIVGASATGTWSGKDNQLAFYDNGWRFIEAREGFTFWVNDENKLYSFDGSNWIETLSTLASSQNLNSLTDVAISSASQYDLLQHNGTNFVNTKEIQNLSLVGVNTTADSTNKLSVKSDSVLFDNATDDSRVKVNKSSSSDTASHLFQSNYSGRAEFGLIGNDNFTLKVSSDGENWNNAFVVDKETGNIDFKGIITNNGDNICNNNSNNNGFNLLNNISITENTSEIILNVDNTKRYKIFINNLKGDQTVSTTAYLYLQFGDDSSFNSTENYAYGSERIFTGGIWTFAPESQKNLTSLPIKYTDAGIYNGSGFNAELNLTECNGNNPTIYGDIAANRSIDTQSLRVLFNGTLKQQYNYTKIRLFPSTGYLVSGNIKLYEI